MTKKAKHSLEHLIEKSNRKETTKTEESLLNDFMLSEYKKSEWDSSTMGSKEERGSALYNGIRQRIYPTKKTRPYIKYAVAAGIALLVGLSILFNSGQKNIPTLRFATSGVSDSLKLGDGSMIYLAANSVFEYPSQFGDERTVKLVKGNAFFHVAKDPEHPFIISSGSIKTRVLGTSFHIQLSKSKCNVIVATGKVRVTSGNQIVNLLPGDEASFTDQDHKLSKLKALKTMLINWYKEDAELNSVPLSEVFTLLEYKYGVRFDSKNTNLLNTRLTVFIGKTATLDSILKQINYITNLKFEIYEDTVKVN